jgi:hypothetical protein|uniref:EGF-like domain-containing protein n=1 Tax=Attheya septentrionalis TaxID=420275 RepID=A0A7S2XLA1_9STRA|mmetsp:Transcript_17862/g.32335  ORF Transcript_17862/g.32335 Transcript_17862/m.32335 type:complete len:224 (+) Transcript_17862:234-905(+)|eukprot:CAMPEP_0198302092 /NCGR_PEP_ID=MMETSP1449-20131203/53918_1 /TAXON_ID=420275 /ORGANISM="Attheya septentrionalis, Strain CCMP2084" /LENGTH=223 /DNA_ID=CAMNT_0044004353 /DNA_START=201 /DNA_END=872 /DNA_ORIENTATION=-
MSSVSFEECPDGHRCENDSICVEREYDQGSYYCDCDEAGDGSRYVGLYCEHKATNFCTFREAVSESSFCTNNGDCIAEVSAEKADLICDCKPGYEGKHCQFVTGSQPDDWPNTNAATSPVKSTSSSGMGAGGKAALSLFFISIIFGGLFYIFRGRRSKKSSDASESIDEAKSSSYAEKEMSPEHALEPDGEILQAAVNSSSMEDPATTEFVEEDPADNDIELV